VIVAPLNWQADWRYWSPLEYVPLKRVPARVPEKGTSSVGQFFMSSSSRMAPAVVVICQPTPFLVSPGVAPQPQVWPGPEIDTTLASAVQFAPLEAWVGTAEGPPNVDVRFGISELLVQPARKRMMQAATGRKECAFLNDKVHHDRV
jgi:hypothetical protein